MRFTVRQADRADAEGIAAAHVDSIQSLGAHAYSPQVVAIWGAPRDGTRYRSAMAAGEVFFVATADGPEKLGESLRTAPAPILGFSSHHVEEGKHRTAVYVRGSAARAGVGTALFKAAEARARMQGASEIHVDAALLAVEFYQALGFTALGAGQHWMRGIAMDCVLMKKTL